MILKSSYRPCAYYWFSVLRHAFKIDQNKNKNHSTDKVQNLGNERR